MISYILMFHSPSYPVDNLSLIFLLRSKIYLRPTFSFVCIVDYSTIIFIIMLHQWHTSNNCLWDSLNLVCFRVIIDHHHFGYFAHHHLFRTLFRKFFLSLILYSSLIIDFIIPSNSILYQITLLHQNYKKFKNRLHAQLKELIVANQ